MQFVGNYTSENNFMVAYIRPIHLIPILKRTNSSKKVKDRQRQLFIKAKSIVQYKFFHQGLWISTKESKTSQHHSDWPRQHDRHLARIRAVFKHCYLTTQLFRRYIAGEPIVSSSKLKVSSVSLMNSMSVCSYSLVYSVCI